MGNYACKLSFLEVIFGFLYVEFQLLRFGGSCHQSLQSAKSGFVERTAMFEIARLGNLCRTTVYI